MKKLLGRYFVLDGDNMPIRGYYNPYEDFNGFQCPYFLESDFAEFCEKREWTFIHSKKQDTIIVDFSDRWIDMEELPIVCRMTLRHGWMNLISGAGWVWHLAKENGEMAGDGETFESKWDEILQDQLTYDKTG